MEKLNIDHIVFIGRTYSEYLKFFDLDEEKLGRGPVLDCAAGPSSFTAEACNAGFDVKACDILYNLNPVDLFLTGNKEINCVFENFEAVSQNYSWEYYRDKEQVISFRKMALGQFTKDYIRNKNSGRYKQAELPVLPYPDNNFALALSSHFLFLYGDRMDLDFHIACLKELVRVCSSEVRIFPLCGLDTKPYQYLDDVMSYLNTNGIKADIIEVPFEFQKGGNRMMKIDVK